MRKSYKSVDELPLGLNADQVGDILGISRTKAYELVKSEGFPKIQLGKRIVIPKDAFIRWIEQQTNNSRQHAAL